jgi:hypothetical protein
VLALVALLAAATAWVGLRAFMAKSELERAVPLASAIPSEILAGDGNHAGRASVQLSAHAMKAAELTSDPVWRAFETVPILGPNLTAFRELAQVVQTASKEAVVPLAALAGRLDLNAFKPVNGGIDLGPLIAARPEIASAADALSGAAKQMRAIDTSATLGAVTSAVRQLGAMVERATREVVSLNDAVRLMPAMLGSNEPRSYLLLFQNNAELRATGGLPGAFAQINTDRGRIQLVKQAAASGMVFTSPVLDLPTETRGIYSDRISTFMGDVTLTPYFPTSAQLAREMWKRKYGTVVDGVISVDPVSLSYLLRATGPIALATGDVLTSDNAVKMLLTDVYARYDKPADQDVFFAAAASAVFKALAAGPVDPKALIGALAQAGDERRILLWSAHKADQQVLAGTTLTGDLPVSDAAAERFGVYLNDGTGAKMGTYLDVQIGLGEAVCRKDGRPYYAVDVKLTNTAPTDAAATLSESVTGGGFYGVPPGNVKTLVLVYGPRGTQQLGVTRDGKKISYHPATDSGYPVSQMPIELAPGESESVRVHFLGGARTHGKLVVETTPVIDLHETQKVNLSCESPLW